MARLVNEKFETWDSILIAQGDDPEWVTVTDSGCHLASGISIPGLRPFGNGTGCLRTTCVLVVNSAEVKRVDHHLQ